MRRILMCLAAGLVLGVVYPVNASAQDSAVTMPPMPPPGQQPVLSDTMAALQQLANTIRQRLSTFKTQPSVADFATELKGFDAIIAAHPNGSPDDLATVLVAESSLYADVFNDYDQATNLLLRVKTDFPTSETAKHIDEMVSNLQQAKAFYLTQQTMKPGKVFPDFTDKTVAGQDISLSQFRGKIVLVDFWATWCPPCVSDLPRMKALYQKYHDKGFEIVSISFDKTVGDVTNFVRQQSVPWAQIFDAQGWDGQYAKRYGVDRLPTLYLLDRNGRIVGSNIDGFNGLSLEEQLNKLMPQ